MSISGVSRLEVFWKGSYSGKSFGETTENCEALHIVYKKEHVIEAPLDTHLPCEIEQQLQLMQNWNSGTPASKSFTIYALPHVFKLMQVIARVSIDLKQMIPLSNGFLTFHRECLQKYVKPIFIKSMPEFQPGKLYQLYVVNNNFRLTGIFKEIVVIAPISQPKKMESVTFPFKPVTCTKLDRLRKSLHGLASTSSTSFKCIDRELSKFTTFALHNKLKASKILLKRARNVFNHAVRKEDRNALEKAITEKQNIETEMTAIERTLENRKNFFYREKQRFE